jgi:hypothetical protein
MPRETRGSVDRLGDGVTFVIAIVVGAVVGRLMLEVVIEGLAGLGV